MPAKMFEGYGRMTPGGLYLPSDLQETLSQAARWSQEGQDLEKAAKVGQQIDRKMGALMSLYYALFTGGINRGGAADKPLYTPTHVILRQTAKQSLVDALLINARRRQIQHVSNRITVANKQKGWQVRHIRHSDPYFKSTPDIDKRCREMEQMLLDNNARDVHPSGFRDVLQKAVAGQLIIDRKVMIVQRDYNKKPTRWYLLPPDNIKPRFEVMLKKMNQYKVAHEEQVVEMVYKETQGRVDLTDKAWIQEIDNIIYGAWREDECYVDITNPSDEIDHFGYGISCLELSLEATTLLMLGLHYNKQNFLSNYPEAFLMLKGEIDATGLEMFKSQIYKDVGPQGNQRLPVFATGGTEYDAQLLRLRDTMNDMQFVQLIRMAIALKCAAFRAHPSLINFSPDLGDKTPIIQEPSEENIIASTTEEGFHSLLDSLAWWFTDNLVRPTYDDLTLVWSVEDLPNERDRTQLAIQRASLGETVDEWRASEARRPLAEVTGVDGNYVNSPFFFQHIQMQMAMEQQEQMQQQEQERSNPENFSGAPEADEAQQDRDSAFKPAEAKKPRKKKTASGDKSKSKQAATKAGQAGGAKNITINVKGGTAGK